MLPGACTARKSPCTSPGRRASPPGSPPPMTACTRRSPTTPLPWPSAHPRPRRP